MAPNMQKLTMAKRKAKFQTNPTEKNKGPPTSLSQVYRKIHREHCPVHMRQRTFDV